MNCAQVKEQLIDYLYDELPARARDAFTEHLRGCPACQAEVASYQSTLGGARTALGGPLFEETPARVHLSVIEAAKAAAKQAAQAKAKAPAPRDDLGFFARLWRTPWFLPAFGAASIATVVFLVRVINPEVLPGQRPHSIDERSLPSPAPVPAPEPAMAAKPAAAPAATAKADNSLDEAKRTKSAGGAHKRVGTKAGTARAQGSGLGRGDRPKASEAMQSLDGLRMDEGRTGAGAQRQFAEPPPPWPAGRKSSRDVDDFLGGFKDTETTQRRAQPMVAPAANKAERASSEEARREVQSEKVAPPTRKAPQNAPAAGVAKPAAAPAPGVMLDYPAESATSAPAPAAPPTLRRKEMKHVAEEMEGSAKANDDDLAQDVAKDKKAKGGDKPGTSLDESIRKADRLYASQDWSAAAAAYRELFARFPSHKDAPRWRDRMNESNLAYQRTLEAKRKKALSDDPLRGSMK